MGNSTCVLCQKSILENGESSVRIPEEWAGGGQAHRGCWEALLPFARRLIREVVEDQAISE